jgi:hypothetical protein
MNVRHENFEMYLFVNKTRIKNFVNISPPVKIAVLFYFYICLFILLKFCFDNSVDTEVIVNFIKRFYLYSKIPLNDKIIDNNK